MADLIDRDVLAVEFDNPTVYYLGDDGRYWLSPEDAHRIIGDAKKVDAAPVVHGRWEVAIGYDPNKKVQCQNCYKMAHDPTAFCPNCGANMDDTAPCEWCQHFKTDPKMPVSRGNGQYTALTITTVPTAELT